MYDYHEKGRMLGSTEYVQWRMYIIDTISCGTPGKSVMTIVLSTLYDKENCTSISTCTANVYKAAIYT